MRTIIDLLFGPLGRMVRLDGPTVPFSEPTARREAAAAGEHRDTEPAEASENPPGGNPASPASSFLPGEGAPALRPAAGNPPRLQPCCDAMTPEHFEWCRLVANVTDRHGARYVSPLGARRETSVVCCRCLNQRTLALDAVCDSCSLRERARVLGHLDIPAREALLS